MILVPEPPLRRQHCEQPQQQHTMPTMMARTMTTEPMMIAQPVLEMLH